MAAKQPQQAGDTTGDGVHAILEPGRTYRLDVAMEWNGSIYRQKEDGTKELAQQVANQSTYLPKGANPASPPSTTRSYYFKTVPKGPASGGGGTGIAQFPAYYEPAYIEAVHKRRDLFRPEMLARFLLGYTPAQAEVCRFCDDPLNVHFSAAHVISLAKSYGYTLKTGLRRVDVPGTDGEPIELNPLWIAMLEPALLTGLDERRFDVAMTATCTMPKPGATMSALAPLAPEAWYEIYTLAKSDTPATVKDGRLDGVTFRTSRWRNPAEMLAGIGFTTIASQPAGDVELRVFPAIGPAAIDGSDADFEAALDALGLDGWAPSANPRISVLWRQQEGGGAPSWLCAGLLVESPEPIHRQGRVHLSALRLVMPPSSPTVFDIRRSDRSRSRMLWLCSVPFMPHVWIRPMPFQKPRRIWPTVAMDLVDVATGAGLTGSVRLPLAPSFVEEA